MEANCPYCGQMVADNKLPAPGKDAVTISCLCGKKFEISTILTYYKRTNCDWNKEQHEWRYLSDDTEHCLKCDEFRHRKRAFK